MCLAGEGCQNALFVMLIQFLGVLFSVKIFPIITCRWDLEIFTVCVRDQYDRLCLNLNNSKGGPPPRKFFQTWYTAMLSIRH